MATTKELFDDLTQKYIYDPVTGDFVWKSCYFKSRIGSIAGCEFTQPHSLCKYRFIYVLRKTQLAHRMAWLYATGELPDQIDHDDGNGTNNAFSNLRNVDELESKKNRPKQRNNTSGFPGVSKNNNKWRAEIQVNKDRIYLGMFVDRLDAAAIRKKAEKIYGFHENYGR